MGWGVGVEEAGLAALESSPPWTTRYTSLVCLSQDLDRCVVLSVLEAGREWIHSSPPSMERGVARDNPNKAVVTMAD